MTLSLHAPQASALTTLIGRHKGLPMRLRVNPSVTDRPLYVEFLHIEYLIEEDGAVLVPSDPDGEWVRERVAA